MKKIIAFDVETLKVASGMTAWPQWCHQHVLSPTWQYGLVHVDSYDAATCHAQIRGTLVNSLQHADHVISGSIKDLKHDGHALFQ